MVQIADKIALDGAAPRMTPEGYLDVSAKIARAGVLEYWAFELGDLFADRPPFDVVRVLRDEGEVFAPESMSSFALKPVTDGHPWEMVNAGNVEKHQVGISGENIARDGDHITARLLIQNADAVNRVQRATAELSCGYEAEITRQAGEWRGHPYDAVMRDIRGNHIAIVDQGRCGPSCKIGDRAPTISQKHHARLLNDCNGSPCMTVQSSALQAITLDGFSGNADANGAVLFKKVADDLAAARRQIEAKDGEIAALRKAHADEKAALETQLADLKASAPTAGMLDAMARERGSLIATATRIMGDAYKADGKSSEEIRREVVAAKLGDAASKDRSADYVAAAFDTLAAQVGDSGADPVRAAFAQPTPGAPAGQTMKAADARAAFEKRLTEAYRAGAQSA